MKKQKFKNQGNGSENEDKALEFLRKELGLYGEKVSGKGNTPDAIIDKNYGFEFKKDFKDAASYVTFKTDRKLLGETGQLEYTSNADSPEVIKAKQDLWNYIHPLVINALPNVDLIPIYCSKKNRLYSCIVPADHQREGYHKDKYLIKEPESRELRKELIGRKHNILVPSHFVRNSLIAKGNAYLMIGEDKICPLIDNYLDIPKKYLIPFPDHYIARLRDKKHGDPSQYHSFELEIFCEGYLPKEEPKTNSTVRLEY